METTLRQILTWSLSRLTGALVAGLVGLAFMQVVLRYIFNSAILWVEEISVMALIWLAWVGIVYLWLTKGHIAVDLIGAMLSDVQGRWLAHAIDLLALAGGIALLTVSIETLNIYSSMELGSLEIDASIKYLPVTVGGGGIAVAACLNIWQRWLQQEPGS